MHFDAQGYFGAQSPMDEQSSAFLLSVVRPRLEGARGGIAELGREVSDGARKAEDVKNECALRAD